jgi:hypothetical protein
MKTITDIRREIRERLEDVAATSPLRTLGDRAVENHLRGTLEEWLAQSLLELENRQARPIMEEEDYVRVR